MVLHPGVKEMKAWKRTRLHLLPPSWLGEILIEGQSSASTNSSRLSLSTTVAVTLNMGILVTHSPEWTPTQNPEPYFVESTSSSSANRRIL